jgi:phage-related protein
MHEIVWLGTSKRDVRLFPEDARREAGYQLDKVQRGYEPDDWKSMTAIGVGVREIRIREPSGAFRILYVVRFGEAVYVLHAFQKKTQRTRAGDLELAKERLRQIRGKP